MPPTNISKLIMIFMVLLLIQHLLDIILDNIINIPVNSLDALQEPSIWQSRLPCNLDFYSTHLNFAACRSAHLLLLCTQTARNDDWFTNVQHIAKWSTSNPGLNLQEVK